MVQTNTNDWCKDSWTDLKIFVNDSAGERFNIFFLKMERAMCPKYQHKQNTTEDNS